MGKNNRNTATIWAPLAEVRISERRRRSINQATVERYRQWLEQGREAPPVRLAREGDTYVVRDGRHRVAAALAAGHALVKAELQRIVERLGRWSAAIRAVSAQIGSTWGRSSAGRATRLQREGAGSIPAVSIPLGAAA